MPRCTIEDIPNEILLQIVQDPSVQLLEQLRLSLTSRRLRSIAELCLYRALTFKDLTSLQKFLRTIVSRPELGAITRYLDVCLWIDVDDHDLDEREMTIIQKLAREKGMSSRAVSELEGGFCQPYFLLLLHLLPKLESLKLRLMDPEETRWAWGQGDHHGPTPPCLQSLSTLEMFDVLAAEDVGRFIMSLPALDSFRVISFQGNGAIRWDKGDANAEEDSGGDVFRSSRYVKRSSKLKELRLYQAIAEAPFLEDILQIPEALETFHLNFASLGVCYDINAIKGVVKALRYQANTLTTLSLTALNLWSSGPCVGPFVSFRDFPLLKELTVSCTFLLGHPAFYAPCGWTAFFNLLPSTLTSLTVHVGVIRVCENRKWTMVHGFLDAIERGEDRVNRWRQERGQRVPHLKTFSLWINEDPINDREELEALGITIDPRSRWEDDQWLDDHLSFQDPADPYY